MADQDRLIEEVIPLVEEELSIEKRVVETGRVRIKTLVDEREEWIRQDLAHDEVSIERVAIGREVAERPEIRQDGDVLVVPVVEEVLVVEKRLFLKEELRITKKRTTETTEQPVVLRSMRAVVEREPLAGDVSKPEE